MTARCTELHAHPAAMSIPAAALTVLALLVATLAPGEVCGQTADPASVRPPAGFRVEPLSGASHPGDPTARTFLTARSLWLLAGFGGAAAVSHEHQDDRRMERLIDNLPIEGLIDPGDVFGDARLLGAGAAGLLAIGKLAGNDRLHHAGRDMAQAMVLSGVPVWTLKLSINATRPNGGSHSFPSGHTAAAFSVAPVLAHHFGWPVGVPAYVLATATALARMEDRRHHMADVLFGAGLGLAASHEVLSGSRAGSIVGHLALSPRSAGLRWRF